jgi:hypothetical protein
MELFKNRNILSAKHAITLQFMALLKLILTQGH